MNEIRESMIQDAGIQELLKVLDLYKMKEKVAYLYELTAYIDGLENKLDEVVNELQNVRKQLDNLQELNERKPLKESLTTMVSKLEYQVEFMKSQTNKIKQNFSDKAKEIVDTVKEKGRAGLSKMVELFHVKDKFQKMKEKLEVNIAGINKTIEKIDIVSHEINEAKSHISNAVKGMVGKNISDQVKGNPEQQSMGDVIKKPWLAMQNLQKGMIVRIDASIEKVDKLLQVADMEFDCNMNKNTYNQSTEEVGESIRLESEELQGEIQQFIENSVYEKRTYNSCGDAFEEFCKKMDENEVELSGTVPEHQRSR